ncbi:hypothetical protein [Burkholderia gladioli]|uniref:hypothetical protein n=1 Tax=Burkholderia gladioli TaxID=28095 RepID=UPI00163ED259|nr:hypothetical protein [Burkholderia gladioli]
MNIDYNGHKLLPSSYQNDDMPGHWFPCAVVVMPTGGSTPVVLPPIRGIDKAQADASALLEAKRRIDSKTL